MFERLENEINQLSTEESQLTKILETITASSCFDQQDKDLILQKLNQIRESREQVQVILQHKKQIYHDHVIKMEKQIEERSQILKDISGFENFPEILKFFAVKQNQLSDNLEEIKTQILS